jgi:hypothetical protein
MSHALLLLIALLLVALPVRVLAPVLYHLVFSFVGNLTDTCDERQGYFRIGLGSLLKHFAIGTNFIFCVACEVLRGPGEDAPEEQGEASGAQEEAEEADSRLYAEALALFDLKPGFTEGDLKSAYKRAIRKAHPDAGGSEEDAQTVNVARDLIAAKHGWK